MIASAKKQMALQFDPGREEFEAFLDLQLGLVGLSLAEAASEVQATYPVVEKQFSRIRNRYYRVEKRPILRLGHNAQYTIFLYLLSRALFLAGKRLAADRVYSLLRMVSCVDLYYEVVLPELWHCDHPLGAVIGRAQFSGQATLSFTQNCTVGNSRGVFPRVAGNLHMYANTTLLGETHVSGNVVLANGTCVIDGGELSNCIVFGKSPDLVIKPLADVSFEKLTMFTAPLDSA